jgi:hypothetical protein
MADNSKDHETASKDHKTAAKDHKTAAEDHETATGHKAAKPKTRVKPRTRRHLRPGEPGIAETKETENLPNNSVLSEVAASDEFGFPGSIHPELDLTDDGELPDPNRDAARDEDDDD